MGVDLRLLPCENWSLQNGRLWGFAHTIHTILELGDVCEEAWADFQVQVKPHLEELPSDHDVSSHVGAVVSDGHHHQGERTYGTIRATDGYGETYKSVSAQHLLPWLVEHFCYDGSRGYGPYQAAIVAFVRALPPYTRIVLDWH